MKELQFFFVWYYLFGVVFNLKDFLSFCSESALAVVKTHGVFVGVFAILFGLVAHVILWPIVLLNSCRNHP